MTVRAESNLRIHSNLLKQSRNSHFSASTLLKPHIKFPRRTTLRESNNPWNFTNPNITATAPQRMQSSQTRTEITRTSSHFVHRASDWPTNRTKARPSQKHRPWLWRIEGGFPVKLNETVPSPYPKLEETPTKRTGVTNDCLGIHVNYEPLH